MFIFRRSRIEAELKWNRSLCDRANMLTSCTRICVVCLCVNRQSNHPHWWKVIQRRWNRLNSIHLGRTAGENLTEFIRLTSDAYFSSIYIHVGPNYLVHLVW